MRKPQAARTSQDLRDSIRALRDRLDGYDQQLKPHTMSTVLTRMELDLCKLFIEVMRMRKSFFLTDLGIHRIVLVALETLEAWHSNEIGHNG